MARIESECSSLKIENDTFDFQGRISVEQVNQLKPAGTEIYYYRTQAGSEYDIVLARRIKPVACIEVKLNNAPTISKGNYQSIADLETKKNFVVAPDAEEYRTKEGIVISNLQTLLTKYLSKF